MSKALPFGGAFLIPNTTISNIVIFDNIGTAFQRF
jgi:hypothetical protein